LVPPSLKFYVLTRSWPHSARIFKSCRVDKYPVEVVVKKDGSEIFKCPQRDLFSKYKWPAKDKMQSAVKANLK